MLSKYERAARPPPLIIAIRLSIIYRSNIEELFPAIYREIRTEVLKAQLKHPRIIKNL